MPNHDDDLSYLKGLVAANPGLDPQEKEFRQQFVADIFQGVMDIHASASGVYWPLRRWVPGGEFASFGIESRRHGPIFFCLVAPEVEHVAFCGKLELRIQQLFARTAGTPDAEETLKLADGIRRAASVTMTRLRSSPYSNLDAAHFKTNEHRTQLDAVRRYCESTSV